VSLVDRTIGASITDIWSYTDRRLTKAPIMKRLCWSGADGDASFTPTTATTYTFPRPVMFYRNLVIGSLATLRPPAGYRVQILCVSDTLQLGGVIDVSGFGGAGGGGVGGAGGGGVILVARKIVGTGRVLANGLNGRTSTTTGTGGSGAFKSIIIPGGSSDPGGGGAGVWGSGGNGYYGGGGSKPKTPIIPSNRYGHIL